MDMPGLKEITDRLATANEVRWYGHALKDDDSVLRVALDQGCQTGGPRAKCGQRHNILWLA